MTTTSVIDSKSYLRGSIFSRSTIVDYDKREHFTKQGLLGSVQSYKLILDSECFVFPPNCTTGFPENKLAIYDTRRKSTHLNMNSKWLLFAA